MKNLFSPGPDDVRLALLVSGPGSGGPSDFDEASHLYGKLAMRIRPVLLGMVARHGIISPTDLVDEAIETGWKRVHEFFAGELAPDAFSYVGPMSLASWLLLVIGKPDNPENGGLIHKHRRADRRREVREAPFGDEHIDMQSTEDQQPDEGIELLAQHLGHLQPEERFVVSAYYGLSPEVGFSIDGIRKRCALADLDRRHADAIVARARRLKIDTSRARTVHAIGAALSSRAPK
ncbi:hypothetical protein NKH84_24015 [Mesorhizobium sp. M0902]|uniref:hypothetical protein n=1 Tax=unclassified Mesorhizobium TaxID=325217 RepID=UPI003337BA3C